MQSCRYTLDLPQRVNRRVAHVTVSAAIEQDRDHPNRNGAIMTKKSSSISVQYPFVTKATIKARLAAEPEYRLAAMVVLLGLQTEHEVSTKSTLSRNHAGFMSSHAVKGTRVAQKIVAGETLTDEDQAVVDKIAPCYSKQLATAARAEAIRANPALRAVAKVFSADNVPEVEVAPESCGDTCDCSTSSLDDFFADEAEAVEAEAV